MVMSTLRGRGIKRKAGGSRSRSSTVSVGRSIKRAKKAKSTTLRSMPDGPFPASKKVTMVYENALTAISGAAAFLSKSVKYNSLYDFDNGTGDLGNKQPLFFDTLLTASGPYKQYKVHSWKATWTFVNTSATPQTIWVLPPLSAAGEVDSAAEADNFPGVKRLYLAPNGGGDSKGAVTVYGSIADVYATFTGDQGFIGGYNSDPTYLVYGGFCIASADGSTAISGYVACKIEFNVTLNNIDALVS